LGIGSAAETGASFAANALLKAVHAAAQSGLAALADDSGLEVDALGGKPGIHSARFAGESASDEDNNQHLIALLAKVPTEQRGARYRCVLALVHGPADTAPLFAAGSWEGRIAEQARGNNGFGYDPWFIPDGMAVTAAELGAESKNEISHRALALRALASKFSAWR
jgi:XTP/dITP diphosphohydrolase